MNFETARFWVLYDAECGFCTTWAQRCRSLLARRNIGLAPLQDEAMRVRLGLVPGVPLTEMKVLTRDSRILGGIDAVLYVLRFIWWAYPVFVLGRVPLLHWLLDRFYRWFAARRYCLGGRCRIPDGRQTPGRLP